MQGRQLVDNLTGQSNPTNLELLRIARDLAYNDYDNRRTDVHNKWVSDSALLWTNQKLRLAYPNMPAYPTEDEVISRAVKLVEFLNTPRPDLEHNEIPITTTETEPSVSYSEEHVTKESSEKMLSSMMKKFENLFNKGEQK